MDRLPDYGHFWLYYLNEHRDPVCRRLHLVGTALVIGCLLAGVVTRDPRWLLACPLAGYAFAWVGHFVFERNRPATFTYPLWSLRADFHMFGCALTGRLARERARAEEVYRPVDPTS